MREKVTLLLVVLIVIGMPAGILLYQYKLRSSGTRVIDIMAAAPEAGGFQPSALEVAAGQTVTLRFHSADVTHGIAIGPGLGVDLGQVDPGHVKEVTLTFDEAGVYTFYCNTWCSTDHWRMRGVLTVRDPADPNAIPSVERDPVMEALIAEGVDIDANLRMDEMAMSNPPAQVQPAQPPVFEHGAALAESLNVPHELRDPLWRRSHPLLDGLALLGEQNPDTSQADLVDAVWYLWTADLRTRDLTFARTLYAKNCAACHGESGGGDGIVADQTVQKPAAFADLNYMFTMRSDVLYAKIRRGGMGTDMPNFGTIFTQDETWQLVDYLWMLAAQNH